MDKINVSPNILTKNQNFKKLRHGFVDERALITKAFKIFLSLENPCTFLLPKKKTENAFLTLIVNYRKIVQKTNCAIQINSKFAI